MNLIERIQAQSRTVKDVAAEAGISRQTLYAMADPDYRPASQTVAAVAKALGVTPADIRPELAS